MSLATPCLPTDCTTFEITQEDIDRALADGVNGG
jgi:hypothetical protein